MKPSWPIWAVLCLAFPIAKVAPAEIHWTGADLARLGGLGARAAPSVKTTQGQSGTAFEFSDGGIECPMNGALTAAAGAVEIAFQVPDDWPAKEDRALFHVGQEPHTHVTLFFRGGQLIAVYKGDVDHYASISNPAARTWTKGSWHSLQYSWQARGEEVDFFLRVDDRLAGMNTGKLIARWPDRFYIGQRNQGAAPWKGLIESVRLSPRPMALPEAQPGNWTIEVDASKSAGPCYNFWSISNFTSEDMFAQPEMREKIARSHPFMKYVNCVRLLGGRSDGKNEWFKGVDEQGKVVCDFAPLISYLKGIQDWGYTPRIVLDNVPTKMSDPPEMNTYGNTYPPKDYDVYHQFIEAAVRAMVDAFGAETIGQWRFRVMTEPDLFPGHWAGTKEEYLKLYDYAVDAVTRVIPEADIGPGNVLDPNAANDPNAVAKRPKWGLEIVDHCATGKNYCTGQTGTRLRYLSCSYYGRVGRPVDTFDYAIQAMRDKLDQYPRFRGLPVEVAEFSVLANESGKRLNAGESTEWTASWFAAIADHAYRLNVARIHQWNTTVRETLTPLGVVIQRLERMVGGERLAVDAKGANDLSQCGAIACRKDGRLFALVYAHRTNRTPKTTENVTLRLRDPRMKKGERWRITENVIDESHGVFLHALYADLEAAGVKPLPNAPLYGGDILKTFGPAQDAVTKANWKKYQEMAKPGVLRDNEPLEVGDGEAELKLEMPTHSVRVIELTPGK